MSALPTPSDADFQDFSVASDLSGLQRAIYFSQIDAHISEEGARRHYQTEVEEWEKYTGRLRVTLVWQWFESQPNFEPILKALTRPTKISAVDRIVESLTARASKVLTAPDESEIARLMAQSRASNFEFRGTKWESHEDEDWEARERQLAIHTMFKNSLKRGVGLIGEALFYRAVAEAYQRYFFQGVSSRLELRDAILEVSEASSRLASLLKTHESALTDSFNSADWHLEWTGGGAAVAGLRQQTEDMERQLADRKRMLIPSARNDDTLGERMLLWDLRRAVVARYGDGKTSVIQKLMAFDGVAQVINERNLKRKLQEWREADQSAQ